MIITGANLKELMEQYNVVPSNCYDKFSFTLHLCRTIRKYDFKEEVLTYGEAIDENRIKTERIVDNYIIYPGQAILACSSEVINMPKGYMGFLQTKGSLARLFITVHCCDGQIEPGFKGCVTFEICNIGSSPVKLLPDAEIAQLFIASCSSDKEEYCGRYNNSDVPTYSKSQK